ncbi:MAG: pyrimidine/purine nucleoside phosphorylase [Bacteroidales bacterium]|nr:pyrimidine/purine nucleoside phosphorylase [Bacteroidales bacterium]
MISVNEYFDGNVKSMGLENEEGRATVGVMAPGEYEFGTSTVEYMTLISGSMTVLLPGETKWKTYKPFQTFMVPKDTKFSLRLEEASAYKCLYK